MKRVVLLAVVVLALGAGEARASTLTGPEARSAINARLTEAVETGESDGYVIHGCVREAPRWVHCPVTEYGLVFTGFEEYEGDANHAIDARLRGRAVLLRSTLFGVF